MQANKNDIDGSLISYFSTLVKTYGGINLAQGIPGFNPPKRLLEILAEIKNDNVHQYAPGRGNIKLLNQIRGLYHGKYSKSDTDFIVLNGATEAISLLYTYLYNQFKTNLNVLTFTPAYESYINLPAIFGNKLFFQNFDSKENINLQDLEENIQKHNIKLVFLASPGNPWGKVIAKEHLKKICKICSANKCYIIIDAVYSELYFGEISPVYPLKNIDEFVFYVNSFSKLFSITGWRVGYFLAHKNHLRKISGIHDYIGLSTPAPLQEAIALFLKDTVETNNYVKDVRNKVTENFLRQKEKLEKYGFLIPGHDGGYFIWAKLPDSSENSLQFGIDLYNKTQTAIIPGIHFGEQWDDYIRINIALPRNILDEGINNIINFIE